MASIPKMHKNSNKGDPTRSDIEGIVASVDVNSEPAGAASVAREDYALAPAKGPTEPLTLLVLVPLVMGH